MGAEGHRGRARACSWRSSATSRAAPTSVVFAGSLPRGVSDDVLRATRSRELTRRGVRVVLDTEGEPLRLGVEAEPWLVSPNQHEAEQLVGQELVRRGRLRHGARHDRRARRAQRPHHASRAAASRSSARSGGLQRYRAVAPRLEPVSDVGAGDALLAQWLTSISTRPSAEEAIRLAVGDRRRLGRSRSAPAASTRPRPAGSRARSRCTSSSPSSSQRDPQQRIRRSIRLRRGRP